MDFLDAYSYGYDQVSVTPVRHVSYDDSAFTLYKNSTQDPVTKTLVSMAHEKQAYHDYMSNPPPYSNMGMQRHYDRRQIKENIEDILRPYSRNMCLKDNVRDQIQIKGNDIKELEQKLKESPKSELCSDCRMTKKCEKCEKCETPSNYWFGDTTETNLFLLVLVVILSAFCVIQYVNTQNINTTLLGMINRQPPGEAVPWLKPTTRNLPEKNTQSPYIRTDK